MKRTFTELTSFLLISLVVSVLSACATHPVVKEVVSPEPVVIAKTTYVLVAIPDNLLTPCSVEQPPSIKDYLAADWPNKEAMLTVYVKSLLGNLAICNAKFPNLKKWNQSQKDIYDIKPKEE